MREIKQFENAKIKINYYYYFSENNLIKSNAVILSF